MTFGLPVQYGPIEGGQVLSRVDAMGRGIGLPLVRTSKSTGRLSKLNAVIYRASRIIRSLNGYDRVKSDGNESHAVLGRT